MNICKRVKGLLLTDYLDGELDQEACRRVEGHLARCPACSRLLKELKEGVVSSFKQALPQQVPETLWPSLLEKIREEEAWVSPWRAVLEKVLRVLSLPGLATALAGLIVLVLTGSVVFYNQYSREQGREQYLSGVLSAEGNSAVEIAGNDFGTTIEEYFL